MGVCSRQPLAEDKGVHCEVESEGSRRQNSAPRNTNHIRHIRWDEAAKQVKVQRLHGTAGCKYGGEMGRKLRITLPREVSQTYGNRVRSTDNNCCEKSAEAIVVLIRAANK
jgi:hypothetical protein